MMVEVLLSGVKPFTGKKRYLDAPVTSESHLNKLQHLNNIDIDNFLDEIYCKIQISLQLHQKCSKNAFRLL